MKLPGFLRPEEFLAFERGADEKNEYYDGVVVAMSGASRQHVTVTMNLTLCLGPQALRQGCRPYGSDLRVAPPNFRSYLYPNLSLVCGEPTFQDDQFDVLTNPVVVVEVLSPSTEGRDRGEKFRRYAEIPSLEAYLIVASLSPRIEVYRRQGEHQWLLTPYEGLGAVASLERPELELPLADVYEGVVFPPEPGPLPDPASTDGQKSAAGLGAPTGAGSG